MPPIKGWEKEKDRKTLEQWVTTPNVKTRVILSRYRFSPTNNWQVIINRLTTEENILRKEFETKEEAKEFAINWMRNHPRG